MARSVWSGLVWLAASIKIPARAPSHTYTPIRVPVTVP